MIKILDSIRSVNIVRWVAIVGITFSQMTLKLDYEKTKKNVFLVSEYLLSGVTH